MKGNVVLSILGSDRIGVVRDREEDSGGLWRSGLLQGDDDKAIRILVVSRRFLASQVLVNLGQLREFLGGVLLVIR